MRTVLIVLGLLMSSDALADAKAGEKKAQLCLLCHKPGNVMASAPLLETNVANLSARDIRDIADYFTSRPPVLGVYSTDPAKVAIGERRVAEMNCGSCHGPTFAGAESVPRLAGQTTGYLISQLEAFAAGRRAHPPIETPFDKMGDIEAIAHYFTAAK